MYDTAADVTGVLIARATGMSFGDALRERICEPLGMKDTAFSVGGESIGRLATAYERDNDATGEVVVEDGPDGCWSRPPAFESGGGGLVSTADDYLAFASALLAGGTHRGERVLSRPSVTLMTSDQLTPAQKAVSGFWPGYFDDIGWGFGMSVRTRRTHLGPSVGSYGWPGFYGTAWYNDPAEDMTTILMIQRAHAGDQGCRCGSTSGPPSTRRSTTSLRVQGHAHGTQPRGRPRGRAGSGTTSTAARPAPRGAILGRRTCDTGALREHTGRGGGDAVTDGAARGAPGPPGAAAPTRAPATRTHGVPHAG